MSTLHTRSRLVPCLVMAIAAAGLASAAAGAGKPPAPPPPPAASQGEPPLRGPAVRDRDVPGAPGVFADGEEVRRYRERVPLPVFRDAVMSLNAEGADGELRLTEEQVAALRALQQQFEQERREFMAQHQGEFRELRRQAAPGQREGNGNGPRRRMDEPRPPGENMENTGTPGGPPPRAERGGEMTPERIAARDRLRELERKAPQPETLYTKVWEELTDPQRAAVEAKLDEFRAERARQREESMVRQRVRQRRPGMPPEMDGGPGRAPDGDMMMRGPASDEDAPRARDRRERVERLVRVFSRLPAEEQERILRRLEERARQLDTERPDDSRPEPQRRRPGRRPPPSMDEVDVPTPATPPAPPASNDRPAPERDD